MIQPNIRHKDALLSKLTRTQIVLRTLYELDSWPTLYRQETNSIQHPRRKRGPENRIVNAVIPTLKVYAFNVTFISCDGLMECNEAKYRAAKL